MEGLLHGLINHWVRIQLRAQVCVGMALP